MTKSRRMPSQLHRWRAPFKPSRPGVCVYVRGLERVRNAVAGQADGDRAAPSLVRVAVSVAQRAQVEDLLLRRPGGARRELVRHDAQARLDREALGERAIEAELEGRLAVGAATHADLEHQGVAVQVQDAR